MIHFAIFGLFKKWVINPAAHFETFLNYNFHYIFLPHFGMKLDNLSFFRSRKEEKICLNYLQLKKQKQKQNECPDLTNYYQLNIGDSGQQIDFFNRIKYFASVSKTESNRCHGRFQTSS